MQLAVGVIEIKSIAKGVEACDNALKAAAVRLVSAHAACPGKYEIILTGEIAAVQAALDQVRGLYGAHLLDAVLLGRIDPTVIEALNGAQPPALQGALGIVETFSAASAIKAADTAVKTADVAVWDLRISRGMGGKGVMMITGSVGAVTAAVEAGARYAQDQGLFTAQSVIPNPHGDLWQYL